MAKARRHKRRGGRPKGRECRTVAETQRADPTPETLAKLKPDPLREMVEGGLLDTDSERAAAQINAIFSALCRNAIRGPSLLMDQNHTCHSESDIPDWIARAHHLTYLPWVKAQGPAIVDAVLTLVVDRNTPERISRLTCAGALRDYAKRAALVH